MVEKKNLRTTAEIVLIIGLMVSLGVNVTDGDEGYLPYTCDKVDIDDMMCYKLSRVGTTGVNRNCYYDRDRPAKYKVCTAGWERLINVEEYQTDCKPIIVAYTDDGRYICNGRGEDSTCINEDLNTEYYEDLG